jgi:formylmethanofuran dehydrogenase subunit E
MTFPMPNQVNCLECDREGWSDEMGMKNGHYLCAKCLRPDIDFSPLDSWKTRNTQKS